jgi:hypothetical protein
MSGVYADAGRDFRTSYPRNIEPIPKRTGISEGYLRTSQGIVEFATGPGIDRGGIEWRGTCYRVMGTKFVSVARDGTVVEIGDVGTGGTVTMDYGFDYLAIASGGRLYLYDGATLTQNTDADLGVALSVCWLGGYFVTTDGENIVTTELTDKFAVSAFKYGSSEVDPDPVQTVLRLSDEIYAVNRHTIEAFANVGGQFFPFQVIQGTQIYRGAVGTHAACVFMGGIAFVGSGRDEEAGVYLLTGGGDAKISTREIDLLLQEVPEVAQGDIICEVRKYEGREVLYVHLPKRTLCFDGAATQAVGQPAWFEVVTDQTYRARHFVYCYGQFICGDPLDARLGTMSSEIGTHWGLPVVWEFMTPIAYGEGNGFFIDQIDLVALTGATQFGADAVIEMDYTEDGELFSAKQPKSLGSIGDRRAPIRWLKQGRADEWRAYRFRGDSNARLSIARLDAKLVPAAW